MSGQQENSASTPPSVTHQITFLQASAFEASSRFLAEIMGFDLVIDQGDVHIFAITRESLVAVCRKKKENVGVDAAVICLITPDVDGWYQYLLGHGVAFELVPTYSEPYRIYRAWFREPSGYRVEIQAFRDPRWDAAQASPAR